MMVTERNNAGFYSIHSPLFLSPSRLSPQSQVRKNGLLLWSFRERCVTEIPSWPNTSQAPPTRYVQVLRFSKNLFRSG